MGEAFQTNDEEVGRRSIRLSGGALETRLGRPADVSVGTSVVAEI
jgi:hypothetical protein